MEKERGYTMKHRAKYWQGLATAILVIGALVSSSMEALAAGPQAVQLGEPAKELSAEWWQLIYSLPASVNPVLDTPGADCVVGQRGDVWFLAGSSVGTAVTRNCSVPGGKVLFFPVLNVSFFNSPNACGQPDVNYTVKEMRAAVASVIDAATNMSVTLDGRPVGNIKRVRSEVFEVALPESNFYDFLYPPCASGVYSPTVADGYYTHLNPLQAGEHVLHIYGEIPPSFVVDVTYKLTVVPVTLK
jgi:hypothetical protein